MDVINLILTVFTALVGWPAFLAALINLLKFFKVLPDGAADGFNFWANVLAFVGVGAAVFLGRTDVLNWIDGSLVGLAKILVDVLILVGGTGISAGLTRKYHGLYRGLPLIGKSYSA